jgi:hypothetical protein
VKAPNKQTLIVDEDYMAGLLSEELCGDDSPLADLRVETVSQDDDGSFVIVMAAKENNEAGA